MKVLHVTTISCIRLLKTVCATRSAGVETCVAIKQISGPEMATWYGPMRFWEGNGIVNIVAEEKPDIVHVHAEPAGLSRSLRPVFDKLKFPCKIVLDVHDSNYGNTGTATEHELEDAAAANGIIVPCNAYARRYAEKFPAGRVWIVRSLALATAEMLGIDVNKPIEKPGVAYEGSLTIDGGPRDYRQLFRKIINTGAPLYVYTPAAEAVVDEYRAMGAYAGYAPYLQLIARLSRHSCGMVLPAGDGSTAFDGSFPNKLCEYWAAGLFVITYGVPEVSAWVEHCKTGFIAKDMDEVAEEAVAAWKNPNINRIKKVPMHQDQTKTILGIYKSLLGRAS